jgi:cytochrome d ubiquinol oxidase subunit II
MTLNTLWFILITVLFSGFFLLEGFDYGVGILLPFLGKNNRERRTLINTIGPFWDGNEVWLLTAGGAMFAAFPHWYATLFSGFYLALLLILLALIVRGVAFEFRSKERHPRWRNLWDWMLFIGSFVPALLWGVAVANIVRGVPIDENMHYVGGFWSLLNPYALLTGLTMVVLLTLHGAVFLNLRTTDALAQRARSVASKLWPVAVILLVATVAASIFSTDIFQMPGILPILGALGAAVAILLAGLFLRTRRDGWAFGMTCATVVLTVITFFSGLYPRVMISSLNPAWSLTVVNAASGPYTLRIMTIVALIFVPLVLLYQGWTYWIFRKRVSPSQKPEY